MTSLQHLEERLSALEESVLSPDKDSNLIDPLSTINTALNALASKRERVNHVFKKVPEIQEYLRPGFVEKEVLDVSAQRDYLLLIQDQIHEMAAQLQRVSELAPVLDSVQIRDFRKHILKANEINLKQLDQLGESNSLTEEVTQLVNQYNTLTQQLSEHFVQLDQIVTNLELKKQKESEES